MLYARRGVDGSLFEGGNREETYLDDVPIDRLWGPSEGQVATCTEGCPKGPHDVNNPHCVVPFLEQEPIEKSGTETPEGEMHTIQFRIDKGGEPLTTLKAVFVADYGDKGFTEAPLRSDKMARALAQEAARLISVQRGIPIEELKVVALHNEQETLREAMVRLANTLTGLQILNEKGAIAYKEVEEASKKLDALVSLAGQVPPVQEAAKQG